MSEETKRRATRDRDHNCKGRWARDRCAQAHSRLAGQSRTNHGVASVSMPVSRSPITVITQNCQWRQMPNVPHVGTPGRPGPDGKSPINEDGTLKIDPMVLPYERSTPKGVIGCATNLIPGMEIYASSPETKEMREAVLESCSSITRLTAPFAIRMANANRSTAWNTAKPKASLPSTRCTSSRPWISACV